MSDRAFARPLASVDEQLATFAALQQDTATQLRSVRQQITQVVADMRTQIAALEQHELTLLSTYAGRERRIDGLLDERLLAVQAEEIVSA